MLLAATNAAAISLTRGPYLQLLTTRSVTVVWNTDIAANCSLQIGPLGGAALVLPGPGVSKVCVVVVDTLTPGTAYSYVPLANGVALRSATTFRSDEPSTPFRFAVVGDTGTGSSGQMKVRDRMVAGGLDLIVHTGDMIYPDGALDDMNPYFFKPYADLVRQMVFWPLLGNHDVETDDGEPWRQVFYTRPQSDAASSEDYYAFDHGNAHFVILDSNASTKPGSAQYRFLDTDLAATTKLWKFVFFHHPVYATKNSESGMRANLVPIFDAYDVDMVFQGHVHNYSRTKPLRDGKVVAAGAGTVYVVTGGGGAPLTDASSSSTMAYVESANHHTEVTIDGGSLSYEMVRSDGKIRDTMDLVKGPTTTTTTTTTIPTTTTTLPPGTVSLDVRVAASADDAEEAASRSVSLTSSDLELVDDGNDQTVGMRFAGVSIPKNVTILRAWIQFTTDEATTDTPSLVIRGQAADTAAVFTTGAGNVSDRPRTTATAAWSPANWPTVGEAGANQRTPDLATVIHEIVGRSGWSPGNALALIITGTGHRVARAFDGSAAGAPLLHVDYRVGTTTTTTSTTATTVTTTTGVPTTTTTTTTTLPTTTTIRSVDVRVTASTDDAEETPAGRVSLASSDLELVNDGSDQTIGMRFAALDVPQGATIVRAWVQFTVDEATTAATATATSVVIGAQAADNAPTFTTATGNVSDRPRTTATVAWSMLPEWPTVNEAGTNQRTPDLAPVIQEVVSRAGWIRGRAVALIITGTGRRTARAFDGVAGSAPLLRVEYR